MLVLTRRTGQSIRIGESIDVRIVRVDGDRVVLGIVAPRSIPIVRAELLDEVSDEIHAAAGTSARLMDLLKSAETATDTSTGGQTPSA